MFNKLLKYIKDDEYLVSFSNNFLHVYSYNYIDLLNEKSVILRLKDKKIEINGENLNVIKMEKKELLIKGFINTIEIK